MNQNIQVKAFFDQTQRYLHKPFGVRLRALIADQMLKQVSWRHMLDIGCGDGGVSLQFLNSGGTLTLMDLSDKMLALAQQNCPQDKIEQVIFINQDFLSYQPERTYDVILCFGVLAHVPDVGTAIKRLSSLIRPGGVCLVQFTDQGQWMARLQWIVYRWQRRRKDDYRYTVNPVTDADIIALVKENNLQVVDTIRYSFLLPGMGRLPDDWLYRYQLLSLENFWIARHGTEVVLKVVKPERLEIKYD